MTRMPDRFEHDRDFENDDDDDVLNASDDDYETEYAEPYDDQEEPTVACPYCRGEVHEEAQKCHHCDRYLSSEDSPSERKPWWFYLVIALCLFTVFQWLFF
jgi:hypothetical protein